MRRQRGYSLLELLTVIAIIGMIAVVAIPAFAAMRSRAAVRAASLTMRSIFHLARSRAISRGSNCGIKFLKQAGDWHFALYDDGDGDGVRNDDIKKGIDRRVAPSRVVLPESRLVTVGLLGETIRDPDGAKMPPTKPAVQFGTSTICSFSPLGQATPGTIYITSRGVLYAVRVFGASAKMRVLRYDSEKRKWLP